MSNLFNSLNRQPQQTNPAQMVQQLKSDPVGFMKSRGINIPNGVDTTNPQSIINGLIQSGQIGNGRYQQVMQMIRGMTNK